MCWLLCTRCCFPFFFFLCMFFFSFHSFRLVRLAVQSDLLFQEVAKCEWQQLIKIYTKNDWNVRLKGAERVIDRSVDPNKPCQPLVNIFCVCYWFVCSWSLASVCPESHTAGFSETCRLIIMCGQHSSSCLPLFFFHRLDYRSAALRLSSSPPESVSPAVPFLHLLFHNITASRARSIKESGHVWS